MKTLLLVLGLSFAGVDPLGLTILLGALASGAKKPQVVAFALATLLGTIVLGVLFSLFGERVTSSISHLIPNVNDPGWAVVEAVVALLIGYWLITQLFKRAKAPKKRASPKAPSNNSVFGLALAGLAFSLTALPDPTFIATAGIASQASDLLTMIGILALWALISQLLLFGFAVAYLFDAHQSLSDFAKPIWERIKRPVKGLLYVTLFALALGLAADAISVFITGAFIIQF